MSAVVVRRIGRVLLWLAQLAALACARPAAVSGPHEPAPEAVAKPAEPAHCPRVERAARMWIGFASGVVDEDMVLALDTIAPIQQRLGQIFCTAASADARPHEIVSIELLDAVPSAAGVMLRCLHAAGARDLKLTLEFVGGAWQPAADSLATYMAACRARRQEPNRTEKAAP